MYHFLPKLALVWMFLFCFERHGEYLLAWQRPGLLGGEEAYSHGILWDLPRLAGESWDGDAWVLGAGGCYSGLISKEWWGGMSSGSKAMQRRDPLRSGIMFISGFAFPSWSTNLNLKAAFEMERLSVIACY